MKPFSLAGALLLVMALLLSSQSMAQDGAGLPEVVREREHGGQVVFVRPVSKGAAIVSVDYEGSVFLWDPSSRRQIATHLQVPFPVKTATMLDEYTLLAIGSGVQDYAATIDIRGNRPPGILGKVGGEIQALSSPLPNGAVRAVVASGGGIIVRELVSNGDVRTVREIKEPEVTALAISNDGKLLALGTKTKKLILIDVDANRILWSRNTDARVSSLSVGREAGVLLASYDHVAAFTLKRIDQIALKSGITERAMSVAPCSVFQVDVIDRSRGMAICGPAATDALQHMDKRIVASIITWHFADKKTAPDITALPRAEAQSTGYLPFRAGAGFHKPTGTVFAAGANGALVALKLGAPGARIAIERLATGPSVVQRFAFDTSSRQIMAIAGMTARGPMPGEREATSPDTARAAIAAAPAAGSFTAEELTEALNAEHYGDATFLRNTITRWDADTGLAYGQHASQLGLIVDVVRGPDSPGGALVAEVMPFVTSAPMESTVLAVARLTPEGRVDGQSRRLLSIDSTTGMLKEGIRRKESDPDHHRGVCPNAVQAGHVRLSRGGDMLLAACLALDPKKLRDGMDFLRPEYDLMTYWLGVPSQHPPSRTRILGAPSHIAISNDGKMAAVLTGTQSMAKADGQVTIDNQYALFVIDLVHGSVIKKFANLGEPATGSALVFSADAKHVYAALEAGVFRFTVGSASLVKLGFESRTPGSAQISSIELDEASALVAIARHNSTTEIYRIEDGKLIAQLRHPGETITQMGFDRSMANRLFATSASGGISVFNYSQAERVGDLLAYHSGAWIAVTPEGIFTGSIGSEMGVTVTDGRRAVAIDQLYDAFFRPDMLRRRLEGDKTARPARDVITKALATPPPLVESKVAAISEQRVNLDISLKDAGGGIGGLRVFHNGKLSRDLGNDALRTAAQGSKLSERGLRLQLALPLATGSNDYTVTALNGERSAQSRFFKVTVDGSAPALGARKAYVLAIGTNEFDHPGFPTLKLAENSAHRVGKTWVDLMSKLVGKENVVYTDMVGGASRHDAVERALQELERTVKPDDIVAIVVVTHGKILPSGELLTILRDTKANDSGALTASRLIDAVNTIPALTQVLMLDICHAGAISDKVASIYQERFGVFAGAAGIHILASTSAEEPALAAYKGTTVFSHFLLEGLKPPADGKPSNRSLKQIAELVKRNVTEIAARFSHNQVPTAYSFGRDMLLP